MTAMTVTAVGLITEASQAEAVLTSGAADMVALARGMLWNPRRPWHSLSLTGLASLLPSTHAHSHDWHTIRLRLQKPLIESPTLKCCEWSAHNAAGCG
jgi:tRNA-dihydrouridine synthase